MFTGYEHAVLVTNTGYEMLGLGQRYRDRADAENAFDELKNHWARTSGAGVALPRAPCTVASWPPWPWR
jgi:hypothetical protein